MSKEKIVEIQEAVERLTKPWVSIGETPPDISVVEVARVVGRDPAAVFNSITNNEIIVENNGDTSLLCLNPPENSYYKRAERTADYRSRAPGGGPVVKRRVTDRSLSMNLRKQQVFRTRIVQNRLEDDRGQNQNRRQEVKGKLAEKWGYKSLPTASRNVDSQEALERSSNFMSSIEANSVVPIERPKKIKEMVQNAILTGNSIVFANWICPRGTPLAYDQQTRKLFRRYVGTDPKTGFETDYQLQPEKLRLEKKFLRTLERYCIPYLYLKIIADDNPYCLYPASLRLDGQGATTQAISDYSDYCQGRLTQELSSENVMVITWSELLGPGLFNNYLTDYYKLNYQNLVPFLPSNILRIEMDILTDHTRPVQSVTPAWQTFAEDCIKYFALEGEYLYKLFGDNIALAWNDSTRVTKTMDVIRKINGIADLPKIFVLHEKRGGRIIDNF